MLIGYFLYCFLEILLYYFFSVNNFLLWVKLIARVYFGSFSFTLFSGKDYLELCWLTCVSLSWA